MWKRKIITGNLHGSITDWSFKDLKHQKEKRKRRKTLPHYSWGSARALHRPGQVEGALSPSPSHVGVLAQALGDK